MTTYSPTLILGWGLDDVATFTGLISTAAERFMGREREVLRGTLFQSMETDFHRLNIEL